MFQKPSGVFFSCNDLFHISVFTHSCIHWGVLPNESLWKMEIKHIHDLLAIRTGPKIKVGILLSIQASLTSISFFGFYLWYWLIFIQARHCWLTFYNNIFFFFKFHSSTKVFNASGYYTYLTQAFSYEEGNCYHENQSHKRSSLCYWHCVAKCFRDLRSQWNICYSVLQIRKLQSLIPFFLPTLKQFIF